MSGVTTRGDAPLDVLGQLDGAELLVFGATGFLGKVWLSLLLARVPGLKRVHLVVRGKAGLSSEERFWRDVAPSGVFEPLRQAHPAYEDFLRSKINPIQGDVGQAFAGVTSAVREQLRGKLTALVNVAGVVDFNPPLDRALDVNALGMQHLVELAKDLGSPPFLHTSTCYVAGTRTGPIPELDPRQHPYPNFGQLDGAPWEPAREIRECQSLVDDIRRRSRDAVAEATYRDAARKRLEARGEPRSEQALAARVEVERERAVDAELAERGRTRAMHWGWPNTYTYTKSLGEQVLLGSGLRCTIARPAVVESTLAYPRPGWNEGITTSAPIMYLSMQGMTGMPAGPDSVLDVVPADLVAAGMTLALAELLEGRAQVVYQLGTSDTNPLPMTRLIELTGLYKRTRGTEGSPLWTWLQDRYETVPVSVGRWQRQGPSVTAQAVGKAAGWLGRLGREVPAVGGLTAPLSDGLQALSKTAAGTAKVVDQYLPFVAYYSYRFSTGHARQASARLVEGQQDFAFDPACFDWRDYWLRVHAPGLEKLVWPLIEERRRGERKPLLPHPDLVSMLEQLAGDHGPAPALLQRHPDGLLAWTYEELWQRSGHIATGLVARGIGPGDRVIVAGRNEPAWVAAWFAVARAGAVAVPLDPELEPAVVARIATKSQAKLALLGHGAKRRLQGLGEGIPEVAFDEALSWRESCELPRLTDPQRLAALLFTSGTTGDPKGVMLTHANFTALLASLSQVFDVRSDDRVLSVLPLHHTFEFTCGLLLPLSVGARVAYLDEVTGEALAATLKDARVTAMVGVPALWQLLERRIRSRAKEQGPWFARAFDLGLELNRLLGRSAGIDLGPLIFGSVHQGLGGHVRLLISGGAALPPETHRFFSGLGLHLGEGYGLTEAAPVLTANAPRPGGKAGVVGRAIPGVELRIDRPDETGVGEVLARGPNVMLGYFGDEQATADVLQDGWLRTGDLGTLDGKGRLRIVGRAKDVVVTTSGENIYLDDLEQTLGTIDGVAEYCVVGLADPRGGERLGLLARPEPGPGSHAKARQALRDAIARLPTHARPAVLHLVEAELPRTATRKVQRRRVRELLERIVAAAEQPADDRGVVTPVRHAVASVAGTDPTELGGATQLAELAFDSLMWVELAAALEHLPGGQPAAEALARCETIADLEALVESSDEEITPVPATEEDTPFRFPTPAVPALRGALRAGQRAAFAQGLRASVSGREFIPANRQVIVVANHCSHLDHGLIKHALGSYGEGIVALAAADYFFEGNPLWVAYFDQLTNLRPLPRNAGARQSLRQAAATVREGHVTLIFPEGGRQGHGELEEFKPLVGKLALETGVDVLPVWVGGTHEALPKGALLPRNRDVQARIGPPLCVSDLRRLTEGLKSSRAARASAQLMHEAVRRLRDGELLDLSRVQALESVLPQAAPRDPAVELFEELQRRFKPGSLAQRRSWYFSLGDGADRKWSVVADGQSCTIARGKPPGGVADCVVKTSVGLWTRMVREAYAPQPSEFMGGAIKTSDLDKLMSFAQAFQLGPLGASTAASGVQATP